MADNDTVTTLPTGKNPINTAKIKVLKAKKGEIDKKLDAVAKDILAAETALDDLNTKAEAIVSESVAIDDEIKSLQ